MKREPRYKKEREQTKAERDTLPLFVLSIFVEEHVFPHSIMYTNTFVRPGRPILVQGYYELHFDNVQMKTAMRRTLFAQPDPVVPTLDYPRNSNVPGGLEMPERQWSDVFRPHQVTLSIGTTPDFEIVEHALHGFTVRQLNRPKWGPYVVRIINMDGTDNPPVHEVLIKWNH